MPLACVNSQFEPVSVVRSVAPVGDADRRRWRRPARMPPSGTMIVWSVTVGGDRRRHRPSTARELHPAEPGRDRVELEAVDRAARRVA